MNTLRNLISSETLLRKLLPGLLFVVFVVASTIFIIEESALIPLGLVVGTATVAITLRSPFAAAVFLLAGRIIVDLVMSASGGGLSIGSLFSIGCTGLALWHTRHYLEQIFLRLLLFLLLILELLL